jgi:hypothetical protein
MTAHCSGGVILFMDAFATLVSLPLARQSLPATCLRSPGCLLSSALPLRRCTKQKTLHPPTRLTQVTITIVALAALARRASQDRDLGL